MKKLLEEIEKSKYILNLPDDWDDEGSEKYEREVWDKCIRFLSTLYLRIEKELGKEMLCPKITHGPWGSIDISWREESFHIVMNFDKDSLVTYYADDYKGCMVKGKFKADEYLLNLIPIAI